MTVKHLSRPRLLLVLLALAFSISGCHSKDDDKTIAASGTIEATDVNIAAKIPAQLLAVYVDEGARVDSGSLLALQDHSALDLELREAEAAVTAARAALSETKIGARREDIRQCEELVTQAQTNRSLAADDLERVRALLKGDAATRQMLEAAEARFRVAQSQLTSAEQNLEKVRHFARPEEITGAAARLEQLEAGRDRIRKMIDDAYVTAPVTGSVTHKVIERGELAGAGATIVTVTDLSKVYLMIYVTEEQLPRVKLGAAVTVTTDGLANKTFQGRVTYISPEAEFTPKNIQTKDDRTKLVFGVKVEIPNPTGELKKGLPADAVLSTDHVAKS